MKRIRNIIIWSITSLLIQSVVFFGLDKYYEINLQSTGGTEVRVPTQNSPKKDITINIPSDALKVEVSYDGKFISYYENSTLTVVNTYDGTKHDVKPEENSVQEFAKWFPDSNTMALCEKATGKSSTINIFRYNAANNSKFVPTDYNNKDIKPKLTGGNDKISDIAISSTMGIWYIKVQKSTSRYDLLNIDVNGNVITTLSSKNIGKIDMVKNLPNLIYEDATTKTVKVTKKTLSETKKSYLIGTDDKDNLYLGLLQGEKISQIVYGQISTEVSQWKTITLDTPIDKTEAILTTNGKLYINNTLEGILLEKSSGKQTGYKGTLLSVTNTEALSLSNGKLERTNLG